jgi:hypothetical protein
LTFWSPWPQIFDINKTWLAERSPSWSSNPPPTVWITSANSPPLPFGH